MSDHQICRRGRAQASSGRSHSKCLDLADIVYETHVPTVTCGNRRVCTILVIRLNQPSMKPPRPWRETPYTNYMDRVGGRVRHRDCLAVALAAPQHGSLVRPHATFANPNGCPGSRYELRAGRVLLARNGFGGYCWAHDVQFRSSLLGRPNAFCHPANFRAVRYVQSHIPSSEVLRCSLSKNARC